MPSEPIPKEVLDTLSGVMRATVQSPGFKQLTRVLFGEAVTEFGHIIGDEVRRYRSHRILKGLIKTAALLRDKGIDPNAPSLKLLFPLLEGMSYEEDEALHTMWATLLANAANPATPDLVHPSFAGTLRQLSPADAAVLKRIFDVVTNQIKEIKGRDPLPADFFLFGTTYSTGIDPPPDVNIDDQIAPFGSLGHLEASYLIERHHVPSLGVDGGIYLLSYRLTPRGYDFVRACQPPNT